MLQRVAWIDCAKGIGIFLVVLAHIESVVFTHQWSAVSSGIYLFHMPLFFLLSGYLFKLDSTVSLISKRALTLLVPYLFFTVCISLIMYRSVSANILIGGTWIDSVFAVCWFVTCLFLTQVVYNLASQADRRVPTVLPLIGLCVVVTAFMPRFGLPWSIDVVPAALIYFWAGHLLRSRPPVERIMRLVCWPIAAIGVAAHFRFGIPGDVDMRYDMFGTPLLGPLVAVALSYCLIDVARVVTRVPVLAAVVQAPGRASLVILFVHLLMINRVVKFMPHAPLWVPALVILALGCAIRLVMLRVPVVGPLLIGERRSRSRIAVAPEMMPAA